jgi:hypothetical protein
VKSVKKYHLKTTLIVSISDCIGTIHELNQFFKCELCGNIFIRCGDNFCSKCGVHLIWNNN